MIFRNMKVSMHNLGCKVNSYEAEAMLSALRNEGATVVPDGEDADIYIINTCSVTNIADRKSRQMMHRAHTINKDAIVIGAGCYVQARVEELKKDTEVDILLGNNEKHNIVEVLSDYLHIHRPEYLTDEVDNTLFNTDVNVYCHEIRNDRNYEDMTMGMDVYRARTYLKVQDGCNQFCSYCIIPFVRGRIRSRQIEDAVREAELVASKKCHELVLTGIHLSSYGLDFDDQEYEYAMNREIPSYHLIELIEKLAMVDGIERIRLSSLEPRIITRDFVERLSKIKKVCPHFHLSLQSGCDGTLKLMNRHYDTASFRESVKLLREYYEDVAITTDVITGFPGESEEDFEESYEFVKEMDFYELHVFRYSRRKGTKADLMKDQLTDKVKAARSERLLELEKQMSETFREKYIGQTTEIIFEQLVEEDGRRYMAGFNPQYVKFMIPIDDIGENKWQIGEIIRVKGTIVCESYLLAMIV